MFRLVLVLLLCSSTVCSLFAQSQAEAYHKVISSLAESGQLETPTCVHTEVNPEGKLLDLSDLSTSCTSASTSTAYGQNSWGPTSGTDANGYDDVNCSVTDVSNLSCSNAKYQLPIRLIIVENSAWTGSNYLNGTGFQAVSDVDIDAMLTTINQSYSNANIEVYEARTRLRVTNPDIYDFYSSAGLGLSDPGTGDNNSTDDLDEVEALYGETNILNIYLVGGLGGDHDASGTTGFAPLAGNSNSYFVLAYRAIFGSTPRHELGHYLGLLHTHYNASKGRDNINFSDFEDALDNSDCLTTGDLMCDTWPDPNYSPCRSASCTYDESIAAPACGDLIIDDTEGTAYSATSSTQLSSNLMSYNSFTGCRTTFTPCQYKKMQDVLLSCRSFMCDTSITRHFANVVVNDELSPYKSICVGDDIPTFTANEAGCFDWYTSISGGSAVATGTNVFTPSATDLDVNTAGVYKFYLVEANALSDECRKEVYVVVDPLPGEGVERITGDKTILLPYNTLSSIDFETVNVGLDSDQVIGWWVTNGDPISSNIVDDGSLTSALASSTVTTSAVNTTTVDKIYESTGGVSFNEVSISFDCNATTIGTDYYVTPFISQKSPSVPQQIVNAATNANLNGNSSAVNFSCGSNSSGGYDTGVITGLPTTHPVSPTYEITLTLNGLSGATCSTSDLILDIRKSVDGSAGDLFFNFAGFPSVGSSLTLSETDLVNGDSYDLSDGFEIFMYKNGDGCACTLVEFTVDIEITYPFVPEVVFPTVAYSDCVFGSPVLVECSDLQTTPIATSVPGCNSIFVNNVTGNSWFDFVDGADNILASINPGTNDLGTVTIEYDDKASAMSGGANGYSFLPRYWNFESSNFTGDFPSNFSTPVDVKLYCLEEEMATVNTADGTYFGVADLAANIYSGENDDCDEANNNYNTGSLELVDKTDVTVSQYNTVGVTGYELVFQMNHFSEVGFSPNPDVVELYVDLIDFNVVENNGVNLITWIVETDEQPSYELEYSLDGLTFESIYEVTSSSSMFEWEHNIEATNFTYYRLKIISEDGDVSYSPIRVVNGGADISGVSILPNPADESIDILFSSAENGNAKLSVYNARGLLKHSEELSVLKGENAKPLSIVDFSPGLYIVMMQQYGSIVQKTFIKL